MRGAGSGRFYLLGGLVSCACGTKMHGTAVVRVVWRGEARPFFLAAAAEAEGRAVWGVAPPDGLEPPTQALGRPRSVH